MVRIGGVFRTNSMPRFEDFFIIFYPNHKERIA